MQQSLFEKIVTGIKGPDSKTTSSSSGSTLNKSGMQENLFLLKQYPLINKEEALQNIGDEKIVHAIYNSMLKEELPQGRKAMKKAYDEKNWPLLASLAHKMKGGAVYCCASRLKWACQHFEQSYKLGYGDELEDLYQQLMLVIDETATAIQEVEPWL